MKTFRTLDLAIEFHKQAVEMKVAGHLRDQLIRAASSVPLNLSEGNAKFSVKEKKRFYLTAYASIKECQTIFKMLPTCDPKIVATADHLGASIYKLVDSKITEIIRPRIE
jgi:four helix bundle protein